MSADNYSLMLAAARLAGVRIVIVDAVPAAKALELSVKELSKLEPFVSIPKEKEPWRGGKPR